MVYKTKSAVAASRRTKNAKKNAKKVTKNYPKRPEVHLSPYGYCNLITKSRPDARRALFDAACKLDIDQVIAKVSFLVQVNVNKPNYLQIFTEDLQFLKNLKTFMVPDPDDEPEPASQSQTEPLSQSQTICNDIATMTIN